MVKRFFRALGRQVRGLHEAAYILASFSLLSHILALLRDRLLAHNFGAGIELDMYYAAFRIPDFLFVGVGSVVSVFVLIPFLLDRLEVKERAKEFVDAAFSAFFFTIVVVAGIAYLFTPQLIPLFFPGFEAMGVQETVITLTRIMLLSPILLGISNILASITQMSQRFFVYAATPIVYNFGIVIGVVVLYPLMGLSGLAWGVVLGALFHVLIQVPTVIEEGFLPKLSFRLRNKGILKLAGVSLPRTLALAANQAVLLALVAVASTMHEGSISVFTFAFNIQSVPLSIIAASYSVAAFPMLARFFTNGDHEKFFSHIAVAARHIIFWSLPAAVLFIVLRAQIVRVALGSGAFTWNDTRLTAALLALFAISLAAQGVEMLFIRGYYAAGRTRKPLVVKVVSSAAIILFTYLGVVWFQNSVFFSSFLESLFRIEDLPGSSVIVLALAYSIGIVGSAIAFWLLFRRDFGKLSAAGLRRTTLQSFSASVLAGAAAYGGLVIGAIFFDLNTFFGILLQGLLGGTAGIVVGSIMFRALRSVEFEEAWLSLHTKFWKARPVGAETSEFS